MMFSPSMGMGQNLWISHIITIWLPHYYHIITIWLPYYCHIITIWLPYDYHIITIFGGSKPINIHEKPAIFSGSLWMPGPGPSAVDRGFTLLWPLGIRLVAKTSAKKGGSGMEKQFFMCLKIKNTINLIIYHHFPYKTCSLFNSFL